MLANQPALGAQVLQLGRVKKIVKQATDVKAVANDANFAIARATVRCTTSFQTATMSVLGVQCTPVCFACVLAEAPRPSPFGDAHVGF